LQEPGDGPFRSRKGDQAIANVSGRKNAELLAQTARAAAVVGHRDDRSQRIDIEGWRADVNEAS
jgi:hypothetical protein